MAVLLLCIAGNLASLAPAWRAARVDAIEALRYERLAILLAATERRRW